MTGTARDEERQAFVLLTPDSEWNGMHPAAWRLPGWDPIGLADFGRIRQLVQRAEDAGFHALFVADLTGFRYEIDPAGIARTATAVRFEPFVLMSALAATTEHIGLVVTAGTTYDEPFHVARRFAALDHLSGGRAGWNVVTTGNQAVADRFGASKHMDHDLRYARGAEFVDAVIRLWDTFGDDAFCRDQQSGIYFDPASYRPASLHGEHVHLDGPLNVERPVQGRPVLAQAGSSPVGRRFAARYAELMFTMQPSLGAARELYREMKDEVRAHGREPDDLKLLAGLTVVVGESDADAQRRLRELDALVDPEVGLAILSSKLDADLRGCDLDGPLPPIESSERGTRTIQSYFVERARSDDLTVRELISVVLGWGAVCGSPTTIADHIEEWLREDGADGFNVTFADLAGSFDLFAGAVMPELERRGILAPSPAGSTLRERFGLRRPGRGLDNGHGGGRDG